jgi:hypothetical protein
MIQIISAVLFLMIAIVADIRADQAYKVPSVWRGA